MKKDNVSPLDFLNPKTAYADQELADSRMTICKSCPLFLEKAGRCSQCGCFMILKTKLLDATCPEHKW